VAARAQQGNSGKTSLITHDAFCELLLHTSAIDPQDVGSDQDPAPAGKWIETSLIAHDEFSELFLQTSSSDPQESDRIGAPHQRGSGWKPHSSRMMSFLSFSSTIPQLIRKNRMSIAGGDNE
jgi:hypothetical protein